MRQDALTDSREEMPCHLHAGLPSTVAGGTAAVLMKMAHVTPGSRWSWSRSNPGPDERGSAQLAGCLW